MIKRLKIKFIILSMTSLFILLSIIVVGMNIINYTSVVNEADDVLEIISKNKGHFPGLDGGIPSHDPILKPNEGDSFRLPPHMSPELPYESRYFSVLMSSDGEILHTETSRIASVDKESAEAYANKVISAENESGFENSFRYLKSYENGAVRIIFLDCGRRLDVFHSFLLTSSCIALVGFIIVFFVIFICSGRIIRPIAESYEKQKRFITDAGHEMKTPLTIIGANVDLLEMEIGDNESLSEITMQTSRLRDLTNDLVTLARMEENEKSLPMIDFPISEIVQECASSFEAAMKKEGKQLNTDIQMLLSIKGNARSIEQLVSILLTNALKYSSDGSEVKIGLYSQGRSVVLWTQNEVDDPIDKEKLGRVFDRFYRLDASRNSEVGGHGIGLSIAKAIVTAHNGKISAQSLRDDGRIFKIVITLPV